MILRLGKFPFLNCVPIYYALEVGKIKCKEKLHFISAPPTRLNFLFKKGKLDISPVSSVAYCEMVNECMILPEISISAKGKVKSVILFSRVPIEELNKQPVLLTSQSTTSIVLLKLIFKKYFGIEPIYQEGEIIKANGAVTAGLAIGDTALILKAQKVYPYQFDLGEIWYQWTGLPFVFSLFVARKTLFEVEKEKIKNVWEMLLASKKWGLSHLDTMALSYNTFNNPIAYWQSLDYDLSHLHLKSLKLFFQYLNEIGEIVSVPKIRLIEA